MIHAHLLPAPSRSMSDFFLLMRTHGCSYIIDMLWKNGRSYLFASWSARACQFSRLVKFFITDFEVGFNGLD